jgi:hypothetical protein
MIDARKEHVFDYLLHRLAATLNALDNGKTNGGGCVWAAAGGLFCEGY